MLIEDASESPKVPQRRRIGRFDRLEDIIGKSERWLEEHIDGEDRVSVRRKDDEAGWP